MGGFAAPYPGQPRGIMVPPPGWGGGRGRIETKFGRDDLTTRTSGPGMGGVGGPDADLMGAFSRFAKKRAEQKIKMGDLDLQARKADVWDRTSPQMGGGEERGMEAWARNQAARAAGMEAMRAARGEPGLARPMERFGGVPIVERYQSGQMTPYQQQIFQTLAGGRPPGGGPVFSPEQMEAGMAEARQATQYGGGPSQAEIQRMMMGINPGGGRPGGY